MKLDISADPAGRAAEAIAWDIRERAGPFHLAISGGRTPWAMCRALAGMWVDWERVHVWQVDERIAPRGDPDQNWTHLRASLTVPAVFHRIPVEEPDAASRYAEALPALDCVQLGLGVDGHTASLFGPDDPPGTVALSGPYDGRQRVTLTFQPIREARRVLWLVTGAEKRDALMRLLQSDPTIPAGRVGRTDAVVFCDRALA